MIDSASRTAAWWSPPMATGPGISSRETVAEYLFDRGRWDDALAELEPLFEPGADVVDFAVLGGRGVAGVIAGHRDDRAGPRRPPARRGRTAGSGRLPAVLCCGSVAGEGGGRRTGRAAGRGGGFSLGGHCQERGRGAAGGVAGGSGALRDGRR